MEYVVFASLVIAILVVILLAVFGIRVQRNNIWLMGYLAVLAYSCWIGYLMDTRSIYKFPHLIRTGTVCGYLIVPMLYLYVQSTCYPGIIWKPWYVLLFIPSLFFIIDLFPFWLQAANEKIRIFEDSMQSLKSLHAFSEGWISPRGFHFGFRLAWSLGWFIAILVLIIRNRQLIGPTSRSDNQAVYRFMLGLTLLSLPFLIIHLALILFFNSSYTVSNFTYLLALPLLIGGGYLMFFPRVVYGLQIPQTDRIPPSTPAAVIPKKQNTPSIFTRELGVQREHEQAYKQYTAQVQAFMEKERPYLNPGLTINQLSSVSGIPTYILSLLINRQFGKSFNAWLNAYRVEAFKQKLTASDARSYTMESLGKAVGFGSRATLINAFKKQTGMTPGQFLRQQGAASWPELE